MMPLRILLLAPACPHPFGDTAAKWIDVLIRELVRRGHRVDLVCVSEEPDSRVEQSRRALAEVAGPGSLHVSFHRLAITRSALGRKLRSLRRPFSEIEQADGVRRLVDERLRRGYDVLHVEQLWSGWLSVGLPRSLLNVHHLEVIDREFDRPGSWSEWKTLRQMRRATAAILTRARQVRFFSARLSAVARAYNQTALHWVVPFALDGAHYELLPAVSEPVVGLIGSMHWSPSRSAAERLITRIWPRVRARCQDARLLIGGWNATRHLSAYVGTPGLEICADVPHPREFFARIGAMVYAPGRGSGMKIKVMEAMAFGVPVVTTSEGVEGLAVESDRHARVADEDSLLADHVVDLLRDHAAAQRMRLAARALIFDQYNPRVVVDRMMDIYGMVAAG
jgi:glycosyltransferase involved in cell wall biosynthesis